MFWNYFHVCLTHGHTQPVFTEDSFHMGFCDKYFTHVTFTLLITPHFIVRKLRCRMIEFFAIATHEVSKVLELG